MAEERLEEIRSQRLAKREALIAAGTPPYPSEVRRTHTTKELTEKFETIQTENSAIIAVGKITSLRKHGGLVFMDIEDGSGSFQLQITKDDVAEEIFSRITTLDTGDYIQAAGSLTLTARGVKTLLVKEFHLLSKAIRPTPSAWFGLKDEETRHRQQELDLLLNKDRRETFKMRSQILAWIRNHFISQGFLEVETPVLQPIAGGTTAKPFMTHHNALDMTLYLRIAPELYLKRLIVGGFEQVFEIGRNFRNEGIDREHNPEFTMLEFYWAYKDYEDLMDFTDTFFSSLITAVKGTPVITWQDKELNFGAPLKRLRYVDIVSEQVGFDILKEKNIETYIDIFKEKKLPIPKAANYGKLIDELYKSLIRPGIIEPTIVYDYPIELAPLAKESLSNPGVAEKFQLLVGGMEVVNSYTELNDPVVQRQRFEEQQAAKDAGDEEAQTMDEAYLRAMEYGLPPTAGYGLGIDRLTSIITDSASIRDTILFPLLKPE